MSEIKSRLAVTTQSNVLHNEPRLSVMYQSSRGVLVNSAPGAGKRTLEYHGSVA